MLHEMEFIILDTQCTIMVHDQGGNDLTFTYRVEIIRRYGYLYWILSLACL